MNKCNIIIKEELVEVLHYNPETGIFTRNTEDEKGNITNTNEIAGTLDGKGYWQISVYNKRYLAHHLAWLYVYGYIPKIIDHINGNKLDNRICNLREADLSQNQFNRKINCNNTSGVKGVYWCKKSNRWVVRIMAYGKRKVIGFFKDLEDAKNAANEARLKYHGNFSNNG